MGKIGTIGVVGSGKTTLMSAIMDAVSAEDVKDFGKAQSIHVLTPDVLEWTKHDTGHQSCNGGPNK